MVPLSLEFVGFSHTHCGSAGCGSVGKERSRRTECFAQRTSEAKS